MVDLLWRGVEEDKARNAFRQALHRLRGAVGDDVLPQDRERLRLVPGDRLAIDLDQFDAAATAGRYAAALELCRGDFLENASLGEPPFDMWVEHERARLRARLGQVLTEGATQASAEGRTADAVAFGRRLMTVAPFETPSAHLAATTLIAAGRRHEARDVLRQFAVTLDSELGLPLPPELQSMLARLERQDAKADATQPRSQSPGRDRGLAFVGRESELSQLVSLCRTSAEESGGFALVKGDDGMGKSRLLAELAAHLKSLGRITVLHGREHIAGIQLPYAVFAEALRPLVRASGVVGASRHLLAEAARLLPELRDEMELPAVTDVEDEAGRLRFFEGIAALIDAAAFERPIVLIVDDVHLAGPSTLELLSYLCARLSRSAVTFILALRPGDAPAAMLTRLEAIARPESQTHSGRSLSITLAPIAGAAAQPAVEGAIEGFATLPSMAMDLVARAGGIPSRLAELVKRVQRGERIETAPVSMRESIVDRVSRLTSVQRRLLFVIALIGRPTPASVAGAAAHLPDAAVDDALRALAAEGLVERTPDGSVDVDDATARASLEIAGASTRAFLSGWIADELSSRKAPPGELARFYAAAGQARPAMEKSRLAAFAALAVGAVPEATHHLQVARRFAATPDEVAAVESLLNAIGAGHRQIGLTAQPIRPNRERPASEPARHHASGRDSRVRELFPNWRLLLGGAIATLVITSLVLADRGRTSVAATNLPTSDTLLVAEDNAQGILRVVTGDMSRGFVVSSQRVESSGIPAWIDSVPRPFTHPITDPRGQHVALERVTPTGSDLLVISADRRDTTPLVTNAGDARALGWSPDGRWLLASVAGIGQFDAHLVAFSDFGDRVAQRVIDAAARRSVTEAAWSPDGTRIAWVARVGEERQLEVFVADADGAGQRNISRDPADDQHIRWSPDGRLLAFTSTRDGNAELYAQSFTEAHLWRLTFDPAQDDAAHFSSDGRLVAFESTRGGSAAVYVMPALGGEARRVQSPVTVAVARWAGRGARYVDRVLVEQPLRVARGDTAALRLTALDQFDEPLSISGAEWRLLDSSLATGALDSTEGVLRIVARGQGVARVAASLGGWRFDTALVAVGSGVVPLIRGTRAQYWRPLGVPRPALTDSTVTLLADREWDSGVLSRDVVPLLPGLVLQASLRLPGESADPSASVNMAFVAPEDSSALDFDAPQFLRYASIGWNAQSRRFVYAVGREFFSEPASGIVAAGSSLNVQLRIEDDSTVSFRLGGRERWRSSLKILATRQSARGQIWISARATGAGAQLSNIGVRIEPTGVSNP